ncbi:MAG: hypothetical protein EWM72_01838 [Nitrospira sp.]|nr:MAG: hypothetical protein EWM72_01838 [Nitrospira sp.]
MLRICALFFLAGTVRVISQWNVIGKVSEPAVDPD